MRLLNPLYLLLVFTIACQSKTGESTTDEQGSDVPEESRAKNVVFNYIPDTTKIKPFDTLISEKNLHIVISESAFNPCIAIESSYSAEGIDHIDRYLETKFRVLVEQNSKKIMDTVFNKRSLLPGDPGFLARSVLYKYTFNKADENQIEFFGSIIVPESDIGFFFYHYLDLKTGKLKLVEHQDKEED